VWKGTVLFRGGGSRNTNPDEGDTNRKDKSVVSESSNIQKSGGKEKDKPNPVAARSKV
jgi:hypothetical protein